MTTQLHDVGGEFERKYLFLGDVTKPATIAVGLYHDGGVTGDTTADDLSEGDDLDAITTEPSNGEYGRQTVPFNSTGFDVTQNTDGDWYASTSNGVTFDLANTTGTVDAYFTAVSWDRDNSGDTQMHLYYTGDLSEAMDLAEYTTVQLGSVGIKQS